MYNGQRVYVGTTGMSVTFPDIHSACDFRAWIERRLGPSIIDTQLEEPECGPDSPFEFTVHVRLQSEVEEGGVTLDVLIVALLTQVSSGSWGKLF